MILSKKKFGFLAIVASFLLGMIFYLKGFVLLIENTSELSKISRINCKSTSGKEWSYGGVDAQSKTRKLLFLKSGDAVECELVFDSGAELYALVVGYFTEGKNSASLRANVDSTAPRMFVNDSQINLTRMKHSEIVKREIDKLN